MNGRMAKKLHRIAPLILLDLHQAAARSFEADPKSVDWTKLPSVRQVYRSLKRKYTRGT